MKKKLIVISNTNSFFGQTRKPWVSMNLSKLLKELDLAGINCKKYEFHEIYNKNLQFENENIFYSFSQKENQRDYIKDIMYQLSKKNKIIPALDLLYCHENKGYQELLKKEKNIDSLKGLYFNSYQDLEKYKLDFPVVLKKVDGSNGTGVFLIKSREKLMEKLKELSDVGNFTTKIDLCRRKYFRKKKFEHYPNYSDKKDYLEYKHYITKQINFVLQEFVPGMDHDFRVLVLYDKLYVTKRHVNQGDFRASGTKKFDFNFNLSEKLLDYAQEIAKKFDSPFLSIDIISKNNKFYLIEYQALHFGINVFIKSDGFYQFKDNKWAFIKEKSTIEKELALALKKYLIQEG